MTVPSNPERALRAILATLIQRANAAPKYAQVGAIKGGLVDVHPAASTVRAF
ncbi:MAG: hypothetical protein AAGJ40_09860 [Planctomycetota bacterium]